MGNEQFITRKTAVFSDIHSNYHAFKACYEDAVSRGADLFIFLGDYVSDLADPQNTLDLVYEIREKHPTVCLRGNRERYMLECKNRITSFTPGSKTGSLIFLAVILTDNMCSTTAIEPFAIPALSESRESMVP